jgi:hypothetical protein
MMERVRLFVIWKHSKGAQSLVHEALFDVQVQRRVSAKTDKANEDGKVVQVRAKSKPSYSIIPLNSADSNEGRVEAGKG